MFDDILFDLPNYYLTAWFVVTTIICFVGAYLMVYGWPFKRRRRKT